MINFRRKDVGKLSYAVRKFNEKIRKLEGIERKYAPDEITYQEIKNNITSRREFNRVIKSLKRFTRKGQEDIITLDSGQNISKWERHELSLSQKRATKYLTKELIEEAQKPINVFGMKSDRFREIESMLESIGNIERTKGSLFQKIKERITKIGTVDKELRKAKIYRENFLDALSEKSIKNFRNYDLFMNYINTKLKNPLKFYEKMQQSEVFSNFFLWYNPENGTLTLGGFASNEDAFNTGLMDLGILK